MFNMQTTHVDDLDFRSLRFLAVLLETVSITRAGEAFGLSQPASSRATERLRRALGDPLIVRGSGGYVLTQRAEALKPLVTIAQNGVDAVFAPDQFEPRTSTRLFRIATTDYGALTVLADAARRISEAALGAGIEIASWSEATLERLENGALDAALYPEAHLPQDFHFKSLFRDDYVLVADEAHLPEGRLSFEKFLNRRRIVMLYPDGRRTLSDDVLGEFGAPSSLIALKTPYFTSAMWALPGSDLVAVLPRRVADRLASVTSLRLIPVPESVSPFNYRLIWHERAHRDAGHRWLRDMMAH